MLCINKRLYGSDWADRSDRPCGFDRLCCNGQRRHRDDW